MEENQPTDTGPGLPTMVTIIYTCLALLPACEALSSKGSSCSACEVVYLLVVPVYFLAYALLLPAAFWLQRPQRSIGGGIGVLLLTLLSLVIALGILDMNEGNMSAGNTALLLCSGVTLVGIVLGFVLRLKPQK
jgi:drug/metabolite transporter (DMT)-like permease